MERGFPLIVFFEKKKGLGLKNFFWLGFTPVPYPELFWGQYTSLGFQTQTPIDFWCKLSSLFVVAGPQWQSFEQFRMQNNQQFPGLCPWTPLRRAYSPPPRLTNYTTVFLLTMLAEKPAPSKKLLDSVLHSKQGWTATLRCGLTKKRSKKRLKHTGNLSR